MVTSDVIRAGMQHMNCPLETVVEVNYNTKVFTFKLPSASHMIVPTGHHIRIKAKNQEGTVISIIMESFMLATIATQIA